MAWRLIKQRDNFTFTFENIRRLRSGTSVVIRLFHLLSGALKSRLLRVLYMALAMREER
jgi:hypothetical protein